MCGSGGLSVEKERTDLVLHASLSVKRIFGSTNFRNRSRGVKDAEIGRFSIGLFWRRFVCRQPRFLKAECVRVELHSGVFKPGQPIPNRFPKLILVKRLVPAVSARVRVRRKGMNDEQGIGDLDQSARDQSSADRRRSTGGSLFPARQRIFAGGQYP